MPTLNRIRFVNIKYNDDRRIIRDDILNIDGENTLALLKNAGGKSVLTKFLMQPIMWVYDKYPVKASQPYFDMKSYFRTNTEPCYVLMELKLENAEGYLLLVSGIAKGNDETSLKKVAFMHHYNSMNNEYSLNNFPLFYKVQDKNRLYGLDELYNKLKKESIVKCYRNTSEHKRDFKEQLKQNRINIKEWEKIHSRIISLEGGLSEVFAKSDTKTTKDLLNNWILESIEAKLDLEETKPFIESIRNNFISYVQEKINAKEDMKILTEYREFVEDLNVLYDLITEKESALIEKGEIVANLVNMYLRFQQLKDEIEEKIADSRNKIQISNDNITLLSYQELSYRINQEMGKLNQLLFDLDKYNSDISDNKTIFDALDKDINNMKARQLYDSIMECQGKIEEKQAELNPEKEKEYEEKTRNIQYTLKVVCMQELKDLDEEVIRLKGLLDDYNLKLKYVRDKMQADDRKIKKIEEEIQSYRNKMYLFETERDLVFSQYPDIPIKLNEADYIEDIVIDNYMGDVAKEQSGYEDKVKQIKARISADENALKENNENLVTKGREIDTCNQSLEKERKDYEEFILKRDTLINKLSLYHFKATDINDIGSLLYRLKGMEKEKENDVFKLKRQQHEQLEKFNFYKNDKIVINEVIEKSLKHSGIDFYYGLEFLKKLDLPMDEKIKLIKKIPIIPYSLIVTSKDYSKLKNILQTEFTDNVVPILIREQIDRYELIRSNSMFEVSGNLNGNLGLFGGYNEELIDEVYIAKMVTEIEKNLEAIQGKLDVRDEELISLRQLINEVSSYSYNPSSERQFLGKIKELEQRIEQLNQEVNNINEAVLEIKVDMDSALGELPSVEEKLALITDRIRSLRSVLDKKEAYFADKQKFNENTNIKQSLLDSLSTGREMETTLLVKISETNNILSTKETLIDTTKVEEAIYIEYEGAGELVTNADGVIFSKNTLKEFLRNYQTQSEFVNITSIRKDIADYTKLRTQHEEDLDDLHADKSVYTTIKFSKETLKRLTKDKGEIQEKLGWLDKEKYLVENQISEVEKSVNRKKEECQTTYGKPYDSTIQYKNFEQARELEIKYITHCKEEIQEMEIHILNLGDKINGLSAYKDEIIPQGAVLVQITIDNYKDVYSSYTKTLSALMDKLKELESNIKVLLDNARLKYIEKYENEVISKFLKNFDNIDSDRLSLTIKKFSDNIEVLKEKESSLEKQFATLSGGIQDYTSKVHQELQKIDKNSRIDPKGKKLFELTGIAKEGMKESLEDFLTEIVNDIVEGKKKEDYINSVLTTYNLLDAFISLGKVQAYAMKFNLYDEVKVRFEETYNGGQCSGAQRMIIAFVILKSIMYYASEGLIDNNKESTSFMFLDNPFGVLSTKEMLEIFYNVAQKFNTTLYSWTDVNKPEIIRQHNVIYYFKLVLVGSKEYVVVEDKRDKDSLETINLDFIKQTSEQLTLDLSM